MRLESNFRAWLQNSGEDSYESGSQWYRWNTAVTLEEVQGRFETMRAEGAAPDVEIGTLKQLEVMERAPGGAVAMLRLIGDGGEVRLKGQTAVRTLLGDETTIYQTQTGRESVGERDILPSAFFYLEENWQEGEMTGYRIWGGGSGHGVGMSQNAAHGMIQAGMNYREILQYFYPGTDLEKLA